MDKGGGGVRGGGIIIEGEEEKKSWLMRKGCRKRGKSRERMEGWE